MTYVMPKVSWHYISRLDAILLELASLFIRILAALFFIKTNCGMRIDNGEIFAMAQARTYQRLEPSAGLEFIEPAQSPKGLLAHLLTLADAISQRTSIPRERNCPTTKSIIRATSPDRRRRMVCLSEPFWFK
jgi:hypothetical protein